MQKITLVLGLDLTRFDIYPLFVIDLLMQHLPKKVIWIDVPGISLDLVRERSNQFHLSHGQNHHVFVHIEPI